MRRRIPARTVIAVAAVAVAAVWAVVATRGLKEGAVYFYTPSELLARQPSGDVIRVGGQVVPGSVRWDDRAGLLRFRLSDGGAVLAVVNRGGPPSLFRGGAGAIVQGRYRGGVLRSSEVIVKHEETYRPPAKPVEAGDSA